MRSTDLLVALCILGCTEGRLSDDEEVSSERSAVLNGTLSGPEDDAVVKVISHAQGITRTCSGTLIARNIVVTAQHCVSNFEDNLFSCTVDGELAPGSAGGEMGMLLDAADIDVHTGVTADPRQEPQAYGARIFAPPTTSICRSDIALVVLDRELDGLPLPPVRLTTGVEPGELARLIGYGTDENRIFGTRRVRDGVPIALVGESDFRPTGDATGPYTFLTEGPALCIGDSGGPAFAESGALLGVFSRFVGACDSPRARDVFTQLAPFAADSVASAFEAAGATPILEPGPATGGTGGEPPSQGGEAGDGGDGGDGTGGGASAGSGGAGGIASAGSTSAGTAGGAGDAGVPTRRGLRQSGGCRCGVPGVARAGGLRGLAMTALLFGWLVSRRRSTQRARLTPTRLSSAPRPGAS